MNYWQPTGWYPTRHPYRYVSVSALPTGILSKVKLAVPGGYPLMQGSPPTPSSSVMPGYAQPTQVPQEPPPGYVQAPQAPQEPTSGPPPPVMTIPEQGMTTGQGLLVGSILAVGIALVTKGLGWW